MTEYYVSSGITSSGLSLTYGDDLHVLNGGRAISTTLVGGDVFVSAGGTIRFTTVSGGDVTVSGGSAFKTDVEAFSQEAVIAGGASISATVGARGQEYVYSTGTASHTQVESGGLLYVLAGGKAASIAVSSGGLARVDGTLKGGVVSRGGITLVTTGVASGTVVEKGGDLIVLPGGTVQGAVSQGGTVASGGVVFDQFFAVDYFAHSATGLDVGFRDNVYVLSGGTTVSTLVEARASELVYSGGTARASLVEGYERVSGGVARGADLRGDGNGIYPDGLQMVGAGGRAIATLVESAGDQDLVAGGTATSTMIESGGAQDIFSGGIARETMVLAGGTERINSGGTILNTHLAVGGAIDVAYLAYAGVTTASLNQHTDVLRVTEGGVTVSLQLAGNYAGERFQVSSAPSGGTEITLIAGGALTSGLNLAAPAAFFGALGSAAGASRVAPVGDGGTRPGSLPVTDTLLVPHGLGWHLP